MELQYTKLYIGAPCMAFLNIRLHTDFTRTRRKLRKAAIEALVKCQHQSCSYVAYFVLRQSDILDGLILTFKHIFL